MLIIPRPQVALQGLVICIVSRYQFLHENVAEHCYLVVGSLKRGLG